MVIQVFCRYLADIRGNDRLPHCYANSGAQLNTAMLSIPSPSLHPRLYSVEINITAAESADLFPGPEIFCPIESYSVNACVGYDV